MLFDMEDNYLKSEEHAIAVCSLTWEAIASGQIRR